MSSQYKAATCIEEDHQKPIFCVSFNLIDPRHKDVFASVGGNRATVYRCLPDGAFDVLQCFVDEDKEESFYVCKWSLDQESGNALLLLAGQNGVTRVLDVSANKLSHTMSGHGNSINDIAVLPQRPMLFLTASKDESIRLWNLKTRCCVLIVAGEGGHKNEVLTLDFHSWDNHRFLSAGMDSMVKVWSLKDHENTIAQSMEWNDEEKCFPARFLAHPIFSSVQVHGNYVDCVRWMGDLCLSKSVNQKIAMWQPEFDEDDDTDVTTATTFTVLQEFDLPDSHIWFVRFSLDFGFNLLACGNRVGKVVVWDPTQSPPQVHARLSSKKCNSVVRQTAIDWEGRIVLAACEDGTIWRWDRAGTPSQADAVGSKDQNGSASMRTS